MSSPRPSVRFGDFDANFATGELVRRGERLRVQDLPMRVLDALTARPGELVTRAELCTALWGTGTFVDYDAGLNTAIAKLREALDDSAETPRFIETVPKRGYRFIGQLGPALADAATATETRTSTPSAWWRRRPLVIGATLVMIAAAAFGVVRWRVTSRAVRVAVALFDNETGRPEFDRLAQQLTDATVFALAARPELAVIGNAAVLRTTRPFRDITAIRDALGVRYLVIGQLQLTGGVLVVRSHLIRTDDQAHVWVQVTPCEPGGEAALQTAVPAGIDRAVAERVVRTGAPSAPRPDRE